MLPSKKARRRRTILILATLFFLGLVTLTSVLIGFIAYPRYWKVPDSELTFGYSAESMAACPEGYLLMPADGYFAAADFCVMKFEAKALDQRSGRVVADGCGGLGNLMLCNDLGVDNWADVDWIVPWSTPEGAPWRRISFEAAHRACAQLGDRYSLITNRQWMAIARNVEQTGANWTSGEPGNGMLARGLHKVPGVQGELYKTLAHPAPDARPSCLYAAVKEREIACARRAEQRYRRTLHLSTGDVIWDMAGNVWDWVDASEDGGAIWGNICGTGHGWSSFSECHFQAHLGFAAVHAEDPRFEVGPLFSMEPSSGIGMVHGSWADDRALKRGGSWVNATASGVFSVDLRAPRDEASAARGFRCTYIPQYSPVARENGRGSLSTFPLPRSSQSQIDPPRSL